MRRSLQRSIVAWLIALPVALSAHPAGVLAQGVKTVPVAPKAISPSLSAPPWAHDQPLAVPNRPPPVIESRPGGCPEGPPCPPQTVAPDVPAVRPGGCPEGDPCPNKQ